MLDVFELLPIIIIRTLYISVDELERERVQNALSKEVNRCRSLAAERLADLTAMRQHLAQITEQMHLQQVQQS